MDAISNSSANAIASSRAPAKTQVAVSVMNMAQDQQKADGEAAVKLIDSARLAREPGKGRMIDTTA